MENGSGMFSELPEDVVLNILSKLEEDDDPRYLARMACVSTKFSSLILTICWKRKCLATMSSSLISDLLPSSPPPIGIWASLYKLAVCCPGLLHSGVVLQKDAVCCPGTNTGELEGEGSESHCCWSLFDDDHMCPDTVDDLSELIQDGVVLQGIEKGGVIEQGSDSSSVPKRRKICCRRSLRSHLASGVCNLSREQGNKLLASRFRGDSLYISQWPGCVHIEEKRNYMLFRGVFKGFKQSRVWSTINDGNRSKIDSSCAFCGCNETWDLHSAFCLRRVYGYHDDGEPVVRAYVCKNGHVSGAWTDWPLYT